MGQFPKVSLKVAEVNQIRDLAQRERAARMLLAMAHQLPEGHELRPLATFQLCPEGFLSGIIHC